MSLSKGNWQSQYVLFVKKCNFFIHLQAFIVQVLQGFVQMQPYFVEVQASFQISEEKMFALE